MKKSILAGVILVVATGGAVAGMSVADKKIAALYDNQQIGMLHNFSTSESDLGFMGGSVDWTADVMLDPCQPELKLTLAGTDTVSKGLTGYTIDTEMNAVVDDPKVMALLSQLPKVQIETKVNWLGNGHSAFTMPAHELTSGEATLSWSDFTGGFDFKKEDDELRSQDLQFNLDAIDLKADAITGSLKNLNYTSDMPMGTQLKAGDAELVITAISLVDADNSNKVAMKDLSFKMNQAVNDDTVGFNQVFKIDEVNVLSDGDNVAYSDAVINLDVQGINRPAMESILATLKKASEQCVPPKQLIQEVEAPALKILQTGIQVASTDNQIKIGDGIAKADIDITLPALASSSLAEAMTLLPSKAKYDMTVDFDKALIKSIGELGSSKSEMISGSLEQDWQTMIQMTGARIEGDHAIIHKAN